MDGQGRDDDLTRPVGSGTTDPDPTRRIDPVEGFEAETPLRDSYGADGAADDLDGHQQPVEEEPEQTSNRGREIAIGAIGAVVGFVIAFVVVALGTSGDADDPQLAAAQEEIEELEATVGERDAAIDELEARLAEAEAAAGARADDIDAQRDALDDRAGALDDREAALRDRAEALDERERQLDQREQEDPGDSPGPGIDQETAEGIVDRVVDQIRDLFQRD
jgi:hypothetical protein